MKKYSYEEALQLLWDKRKVSLLNSAQQWYLELIHPEDDNLISNIPTIVRVQEKTNDKWSWPPNTSDLFKGEFKIIDGKEAEDVVLNENSWQKAFSLLRSGKKITKTTWPKGQHLINAGDVIHIVLSNGKEIDSEFHPDPSDIAGIWKELE